MNQKVVDMTELEILKKKVEIMAEALRTADRNACSCCDSSYEVEKHCKEALDECSKLDN